MQRLPKNFTIDQSHMIALKDISSMECYQFQNGTRKRVIRNITLDVQQGERAVIIGTEPFEMQLLMEIIGNLKPYESGRCSLIGLGMMQKKRRILAHLSYVNDQKMVCDHMQGLSWLMFASKHANKDDKQRQLYWLELMLELDVCELCFKYIRHMTAVERMLLSMMLTLQTTSYLVLADFSHAQVPTPYYTAMQKLLEMFTASGKTILLTTGQSDLAQLLATKVGFLHNGRLMCYDTPQAIMDRWDKRLCVIKTDAPEQVKAAVETHYPNLKAECEGDSVALFGDTQVSYNLILRAIENAGIGYQSLTKCDKSMQQAFKACLSTQAEVKDDL